jgi:flagellin
VTIKIGSNIASFQAQRRLGEATSSLSTIYERLSSGQRINNASDDAAGLAISQDLNVKSRIFGQAIRNVNDGISVHAIADSTVSALAEIAIRLKELAEQSANGTYSNKQREAIDKEAQSLSKEYFRVSRSAQFNGLRLFDGSIADGLRLQVGIGEEGSILTHVGGRLGDGTFTTSTQLSGESLTTQAVQLGDLNGDGILDLVTTGGSDAFDGYATVRLGLGNGNFGSSTSYNSETNVSLAIALGDLNGDGILDLVTSGRSDTNDGYATVRLGIGNGNFGNSTSFLMESRASSALALGDFNGDGVLDLLTAGYTDAVTGSASIRLGTGNGGFGAATSFATETSSSRGISVGDLNNDGKLDLVTSGYSGGYATVRLGNGDGSFVAPTSYAMEGSRSPGVGLGDLNGDGILDLVTTGTTGADGYSSVRLGTGNGSFGTATSYTAESGASNFLKLGDYNGDGYLDLATAGLSDSTDGYFSIRLGNGSGSFGSSTSYATESNRSMSLTVGDINGDGVSDLVTAGYSDANDGFASIHIGDSRDGISPIQPFSLRTKADSLQSIGLFNNTLNNLSTLRGTIGANQSRLEVASANLLTSKENFMAASSRITDADIAQESANLIRTQILQQAATAVLAQANQAPALVIILLR